MKLICWISLLIFVVQGNATGQAIFTFAGNGLSGLTGDSLSATATPVFRPESGSFDGAGNYYVATGHNRICKVDTNGQLTIVAGDASGGGYSGDGGPATLAKLNCWAIHTDSVGNVYIAELYNHRVRRVDASTGIITTIAGTGAGGVASGNGALATAAITNPIDVITDDSGNIYIAENGGGGIRKIDASTGIITAFHDRNGKMAFDVNCDYMYIGIVSELRRKNIHTGVVEVIANTGNTGFNGDWIPVSTAYFSIMDLAVDASNNIYFADYVNHRVRMIDPTGIIQTIAGTGTEGYNGDGIAASTAQLYRPNGIAVDKCGNLYVADDGNHRVREIVLNPSCGALAVSMPEKQITATVTMAPNPAQDIVTINSTETIQLVVVSNMAGQVVYSSAYGGNKALVDVRHLPAGMYVVRVNDHVEKLVIKK